MGNFTRGATAMAALAIVVGVAMAPPARSRAQTPATTRPGFVLVPASVFKDPNGEKTGILMGIFDGQDFQNRLVNKLMPTVTMSAAAGQPPDADYPSNNDYGMKWVGQVTPPASGDYTWELQSTGGVALYVGDTTVIDALGEKGPQDRTGKIKLDAGKMLPIEVDFLQVSGPARCELLWQPPDGAATKP